MAIDLNDDFEVLAATVWGEARGTSPDCREAVACVVMNRVEIARHLPRRQFGTGTIRSACLAPWQFSCWNSSDPNRNLIMALDFDNPDMTLTECMNVAYDAIGDELTDPTGGCCFYKNTSLPWPADWGPEVPAAVTIGPLSFYKLK